MRIFYGVQGTGNGHITRARGMAEAFRATEMDVTFLFTGREEDKFFDMDIFKTYQYRQGLTFSSSKGKVSHLKTILESSPLQFIRDVRSLDLSGYDLIITDFEPVTAWAAKLQKKKVLGIGHQYAFNYSIPRKGADPLAELVMKYFAPVNQGLGFHWHHFDQPLLPPIIESLNASKVTESNKIVVYLPFEDQTKVVECLSGFKDYQFYLYSPVPIESEFSHVKCHALSRKGFQKDLLNCSGVISNAGFELASEALQLGKKLLVKPVQSQMEQISNAAALEQLGYGKTMNRLDTEIISSWLLDRRTIKINYPDVAESIVAQLKMGKTDFDLDFTHSLWQSVEIVESEL